VSKHVCVERSPPPQFASLQASVVQWGLFGGGGVGGGGGGEQSFTLLLRPRIGTEGHTVPYTVSLLRHVGHDALILTLSLVLDAQGAVTLPVGGSLQLILLSLMFAVDAGPWVRPGSIDASSYLEDVQYMLKRGDQTDKRGQRMNRISKWGYQLGWGGERMLLC
jgi:hypothetical protein